MDSLLWVERQWSQGTRSQRWSSWAPEEDALPRASLPPLQHGHREAPGALLGLNIGSKYPRSTF